MSLNKPDIKPAIVASTRSEYRLVDNRKLDEYVERVIKTGSNGIILPGELTGMAERVDATKVMRALPKGLSESDFIGTLRLSMGTECATDTYAKLFVASAKRYDQPWLGRFTEEMWVPDERMHFLPFKVMLMQLGFSEEGLNKDIKTAQEADYVLEAGITPIHLTTFGTYQEYMTDNWYTLQRRILQPTSPEAAHMVARVKQRETLHTVWYRDMAALQVEANPDLIAHVAEASLRFRMPGNQIVPELQGRAAGWMPNMGADFQKMKGDLIRLTAQITQTPERTGRLVMEIAEQQGLNLGPFTFSQVNAAMNKFGSPGYGLVGEALMVIAGMREPFAVNEQGMVSKIRGTVRNWLATEIDQRVASKVIPV